MPKTYISDNFAPPLVQIGTYHTLVQRELPIILGLRFFIKILAMSLFLLYWPLTSYTISDKTNELFPRYLKTDQGGTDHGQMDVKGILLRNRSDKLWVKFWFWCIQKTKIDFVREHKTSTLLNVLIGR